MKLFRAVKTMLTTATTIPKAQLTYRGLSKLNYSTVHKEDYVPIYVIEPDIENGPWIAGGAPLAWFQGSPVGQRDIDVFCKNKAQAERVIRDIKSYSGISEHDVSNAKPGVHVITEHSATITLRITENAVTITLTHGNEMEWNIQVITKQYYDSIQEVIDAFDITVCQIATCGEEWIMGPRTASDIKHKILRFNHFAPHAAKRLVKYWSYGYTPDESQIDMIINNRDTIWDFTNDIDYN